MQAYEFFFWGMASVVFAALVGGALLGRCARAAHSLIGVAVQSVVVLVVVAYCATQVGAGDMVALLAIAAFMFSMVIGTAATLVARRVLRERQARSMSSKQTS